MKYLLVLILIGCNLKLTDDSVYRPGKDVVLTLDTAQILVKHDTLVIIQTYDTLPFPDTANGIYIVSGGWEMGKMNLFSDGKTIDTIRKHTIIYQ